MAWSAACVRCSSRVTSNAPSYHVNGSHCSGHASYLTDALVGTDPLQLSHTCKTLDLKHCKLRAPQPLLQSCAFT